MKSSRATEPLRHILNVENKIGRPRTTKQCKDKIRNLKQAYKETKDNNNLTGRTPKTSRYYDSFDEVLSTRAVVYHARCNTERPCESNLKLVVIRPTRVKPH